MTEPDILDYAACCSAFYGGPFFSLSGLQQSSACTEHPCQVDAEQPGWAECGDLPDRVGEAISPPGL